MHLMADSKGCAIMFHTTDLYYIPFFSLFHIIVISTCICISRWALCFHSGYHALAGVCFFSPSWQHQYAQSGSIAWLTAFRPAKRRSSHDLAACPQIQKSVTSMNFHYNELLRSISTVTYLRKCFSWFFTIRRHRRYQQCRHSRAFEVYPVTCVAAWLPRCESSRCRNLCPCHVQVRLV